MIVWVVWPRHGGMVVARMRVILHEMAIDFTVPLGTIIAFKRLSRVTKSLLHLHLRRACCCAFDFGSVLGYWSNGVDVDSSLRGIAALVEVMSV